MTQAQVAAATGISPSVVSKYEMGNRQPSATALLRIVHATGFQIPEPPTEDSSGDAPGHALPQRDELRAQVLDHLRLQGFKPTDSGILAPVETEKSKLRDLHAEAVTAQRARSARSLTRYEPKFLAMLADGQDVDPSKVEPHLELVEDRRSVTGLMWRWSALHWSVPVSSGYGRRLRFLVRDNAHDGAVMGLIGLGDPVFALGCRDNQIGWTREQRRHRLACVMDAFVLGAIPPYNLLLGGKLMALLAGSEQVRSAFAERYGHRTTLIADRDPDAHLALVTTSSALGRSSVYNRVTRPDRTLALRPIGFTQGSGDFHFSGAIYDNLVAVATAAPNATAGHRHERWTGAGFRNRREVIQRALTVLGFDSRAMRVHGVRRQVFANPLAENSYRWLRGEDTQLDWYPGDVDDLSRWWRERWAVPRSNNDQSWSLVRAQDWTLYT